MMRATQLIWLLGLICAHVLTAELRAEEASRYFSGVENLSQPADQGILADPKAPSVGSQSLTRSEFLRAVLHALAPTIRLHEREGRGIGPLKRTKNEAWLFHKRDELERMIARAFTAAMRGAPSME